MHLWSGSPCAVELSKIVLTASKQAVQWIWALVRLTGEAVRVQIACLLRRIVSLILSACFSVWRSLAVTSCICL